MTDYGFAPGVGRAERALRDIFASRTNTQVINVPSVKHVSAFLGYLESSGSIPKPIGDLLLGAHGKPWGCLMIDLDGEVSVIANYEDVEAALQSHSITIHDGLRQNPDGSLAEVRVHIRACNIGRFRPFVERLKQAFGNVSSVTASRYRMSLFPSDGGYFEYLQNAFRINRKTPFANKAEAVAAYQAGGFERLPSGREPRPISPEAWNGWISSNVSQHRYEFSAYVKLGQRVGTLSSINAGGSYEHAVKPFHYMVPNLPDSDTGTYGSDVERTSFYLDVLAAALSADPAFGDSHPFPVHVRYGFDSINAFVDGWNWRFVWQRGNLRCTGTRHAYIVGIPLTDPETGNLPFNYYPGPTSSLAPVNNLLVSDERLFITV